MDVEAVFLVRLESADPAAHQHVGCLPVENQTVPLAVLPRVGSSTATT